MKKVSSILLIVLFSMVLGCGETEDDPGNQPGDNPNVGLVEDIPFLGRTWDMYNLHVFAYSIVEESLYLTLVENAAWFNDESGGLLYTEISGDFDISATVSTSRYTNSSEPPSASYSFGGITARDPAGSSQNYVHVVTGNGDNAVQPSTGYEYKVTTNSSSRYEITQDGQFAHDLRLVRSGNTFEFYQKPAGSRGNWLLVHTEEVPMSTSLQVGFNIYTASNASNLEDLQVAVTNIQIAQ